MRVHLAKYFKLKILIKQTIGVCFKKLIVAMGYIVCGFWLSFGLRFIAEKTRKKFVHDRKISLMKTTLRISSFPLLVFIS